MGEKMTDIEDMQWKSKESILLVPEGKRKTIEWNKRLKYKLRKLS